jgi:hypothetical protein
MILKIDKYQDGLLVVYNHGGSEFFDADRLTDAKVAARACRGSLSYRTDKCSCVACTVVAGIELEPLPARFLPHRQERFEGSDM